jgi:hypothetical protein
MASIGEKDSSGDLSVGTDANDATREWIVWDTYDETVVLALVNAVAPATYRGLFKLATKPKHRGEGVWDITVSYGPRKPLEVGEFEFRFDIGTESTHITHSLATRNRYGTSPPDLKKAIGWDGKTLAGTDILIPKCTISYKLIIADAAVDAAYKMAISKLVGKVNDDDFLGYSAGELLFTSCSGSYRNQTVDWEINFGFAVSENKTGLSIGGISAITKRGWDYLWVKWKPVLDAGIKKIEAEAVYCEKVYEDGDFSTIGF